MSLFGAKWSLVLMWVHELDRLVHVMFDVLDREHATKMHVDVGDAGVAWLEWVGFDRDEFHQLLAWELSFLHDEITAAPTVGFPQDIAEPGVFWVDVWWVGDEDE